MESGDDLVVRGSIISRDMLENFQSLGLLYSYPRSAYYFELYDLFMGWFHELLFNESTNF
jgi:hypothetical protein